MIKLIFILVMAAIILSIALVVSSKGNHAYTEWDNVVRNEEGDHYYYERTLIEKKIFMRKFPHSTLRSLSRLFNFHF